MATLKGLNYIYKLLYQQLLFCLIIVGVKHLHVLLLNYHADLLLKLLEVGPAVAVYLLMALHHLTVELGGPPGVTFNVEEHEKS